jgi:hypothetical protein
MTKTLLIIPTKDRLIPLNCLLTSLQFVDGDFDIYIGDMSTDVDMLKNCEYFRKQLEFLRLNGHPYYVEHIVGNNQDFAHQAGLNYALAKGYDLCVGCDDDLIFAKDFIVRGVEIMKDRPECGILVGMTYLPWIEMTDQIAPEWFWTHNDYAGKLDQCDYYHCTLKHPTDNILEYEQVYGGWFYRPEDAFKVGGFPLYLSPLGYRGEMFVQTAIFFMGKKILLNPKMESWHYNIVTGGARRFTDEQREIYVKQDLIKFRAFLERKQPTTGEP